MSMLNVNEARERILSNLGVVGKEYLPLAACAWRVLAEALCAKIELPPFDNSGMDGFAVHAVDTAEAESNSPRILRVVADIPAGSTPTRPIEAGEAARIMTGAPVPQGADAIVPVEETDFNQRLPGTPAPQVVQVFRAVQAGKNIRLRGSDVHQGQIILQTGHLLHAQDLGLLSMLGFPHVPVHRQPRLALFSSGDELVPVEAPLTPGKMRDANSYSLAALGEGAGAKVHLLGIAADTCQAIQALLNQAVEMQADLIVSSAGVSVGAFDFVKDVIESHGRLDFWKVNMRPGKPLAFGNYHGIPFFGLPGNPVSAFIGFEVFVRPAIEKLSGLPPASRRTRSARLAEAITSDGRESYLRAIIQVEDGLPTARLTGHQGSGNLLSLVQANALLIIPSGVKSLPPGTEVEAWEL